MSVLFLAACCLSAGEAPAPLPAGEKEISEGREAFQKREYQKALAHFERALSYDLKNRNTQYLAGLAAYWARNHAHAMKYFNALLATAQRDSDEEWRIESARVMCFSAQGEHEAADAVAQRLYDLRRKLPQNAATAGFVREHFFLNASEGEKVLRFRIGAWEVIDLRGEAPDLWTFPMVALDGEEERAVRTLRVEVAQLPGGGAGLAFTEGNVENGNRKVYKYWVQRPEYAEVRAIARKIFTGELEPLKDAPAAPAAPVPGVPAVRVFSQKELDGAARIASWGLPPTVSQILTVAARLKDLEFDVTRLTRAALHDSKDAERLMETLRKTAPHAPEDAAELVELIARAKAEDVNTASENLAKLGARKPYLDYALLTAFNTRGKDVPVFLLRETLQNKDALVRQTSALLLGRYGERAALEMLFKDLSESDALGCAMIHGWLEELLGKVIPPPPPPARDGDPPTLSGWKEQVAGWWKQRGPKLQHQREPKPGDPYWK